MFGRNQKKVMGLFTKWKNREKHKLYVQTFSTTTWKRLPQSTKQRHTLSKCEECMIHYSEQQQAFPGRVFKKAADITNCVQKLVEEGNSEQSTTRKILAELQPLYEQTYGHSFTESLVQCPGSQLQIKPTDVVKKR